MSKSRKKFGHDQREEKKPKIVKGMKSSRQEWKREARDWRLQG